MKFSLKVQPGSKKESLEQSPEGQWKLKVNAPALDGRANERVVQILSEIFDLPKSSIQWVSGMQSKVKIFEIPLDSEKIQASLLNADWK